MVLARFVVFATVALAVLAACGNGSRRGPTAPDGAADTLTAESNFRAAPVECPKRDPSLPTPIPTEQQTPEWLRDWANQASRSRRTQMEELKQRLVDTRASMAHVERREAMIDGGPEPLSPDEAASRADRLIMGEVTAQYLDKGQRPDTGEYFVLVSEIDVGDDVLRVVQQMYLECLDDELILAKNPVEPLDAGSRYAILAKQDEGTTDAWRVVAGHIYESEPGGTLDSRRVGRRGDAPRTEDEIAELFDWTR